MTRITSNSLWLAVGVTLAVTFTSAWADNDWAKRALHIQANLDNRAPLARTTWVGTHNSFANPKDDSLLDYNQPMSLRAQFNAGAREVVFDIHYEGNAIRLCHNNTKYRLCWNGSTGNRKFYRGLDDIKGWIRDGNSDQVVLLKLSLANSARRNINKVENKIDGHVRDYVYRPDLTSYHGDLDSSTGCTQLDVTKLSKRDVLSAGKNIIIFTSESCISDSGFNDVVFYAGEAVNTKEIADLQSTEDKDVVLYRVKDGNTHLGILGSSGALKLGEKSVDDWLDAGLNIFEMYGFNATAVAWKVRNANSPLAKHLVWSWNKGQPNNRSNEGNNENCAMVSKNSGFNDAQCSGSRKFACYHRSDGWKITSSAGPWKHGFGKCLAANAPFHAPINKPELNALQAKLERKGVDNVWINYTDLVIEGEWIANSASMAELNSRYYYRSPARGGSGGSAFTDFEQLALDLYRTKRRIAKVEISAGNRVDKLRFTYSDGREVSHGSKTPKKVLTLSASAHLTKAEVCVKKYEGSDRVFYVKFTTNKGRTLSGGKREGSCQTASSSGKEIFGMHGRAGGAIDSLGFLFRVR